MKTNALFRQFGGAFFCCLWLLWQPVFADASTQWIRLGQGIQQVLDGDTVRLQSGKTVRLIGINTPETGRRNRPPQPLADKATDQLKQWLTHEAVRLETGEESHDRHGRLLAHLRSRKGDLLQTRLIDAGLAWVVAIPPNTQYLHHFSAAEQRARKRGRGVWSVKTYQPVAARQAGGEPGFQFIKGKIQRTWSGKQQRYFALHDDLVLIIKHRHWPLFAISEPESLLGKTVVARGWLSRHPRYGLRMRITHPYMMTMN